MSHSGLSICWISVRIRAWTAFIVLFGAVIVLFSDESFLSISNELYLMADCIFRKSPCSIASIDSSFFRERHLYRAHWSSGYFCLFALIPLSRCFWHSGYQRYHHGTNHGRTFPIFFCFFIRFRQENQRRQLNAKNNTSTSLKVELSIDLDSCGINDCL